jgi:hypothetical protein
MARIFSPETDCERKENGERGASQRVLLLVLLLLVAAGGYLYFFTGLIKPREEAAKSAPAQPATVKMPIPPRPEQPAPKEAAATKPGEKKAGEVAQGKPAPPPVSTPAKPAVPAQPVQAQPKPATPKAVPPQPAPPKSVAVPAKPEAVKAAKPAAQPAGKAPVSAATVPSSAQKATKPAAPVQAAAKKGTPAAAQGGRYALRVGAFVAEPTVREALRKLKKAGIAPVAKTVEKKPEPMNRLFVANFSDRNDADAELAKVKKVTGDAFILRENGTFTVYAGSYFLDAKAAAEQDRLYDKGIKTLMKRTKVAVSVTKLTAGAFPSKIEAQKAAARLKRQGLTAMVIKTVK